MSDLISTGGGNNHPAGCTCPFCTSAVHAESEGVLLTEPTPEPYRPPEQFHRKYESMDEKLAVYKAELADAVTNLADDDEWNDWLNTMSRFHNYSLNNQLLIQLQCPNATRVAGASTWKTMNRHPVKGTKAIGILAPKVVKVTRKDDNGNPVKDDNGKPVRDKRCIGFVTAPVFDVSQTDGEPLPDIDWTVDEEPPPGLTEDLENAITAEGFTVSYEKMSSPDEHGYTAPRTKRVVIGADLPPGERARTLAHELGHIKAGHLDRVDEYHTGHGGSRGVMELEADSISYALTRANGMSSASVKPSAMYIEGWNRNNPQAMEKSADHIAKTVKSILSDHSFRNAVT